MIDMNNPVAMAQQIAKQQEQIKTLREALKYVHNNVKDLERGTMTRSEETIRNLLDDYFAAYPHGRLGDRYRASIKATE